MTTLWITIIAAIVIMLFVVIGLAIGRIITGKNKLSKGCGWTPKDGSNCKICGTSKKCDEDNDDCDKKPEDDEDQC
ncbi:MAG: hypothetical protein K0U13_05060 [Chlamydiae bacterium]|nr:hypothetical protein [Chlamydiota bacterium]